MMIENNKIKLQNGEFVTIKKLIGSGAQGYIYRVHMNNQEYALKVYKHKPSEQFLTNLEKLIQKKTPSRQYIWPITQLSPNEVQKGYLMPLIPAHYVSFIDLLNGKARFKDLNTMLTWAINITSAFQELHMMGYSYQDVNDGSFFLDPQSGDACICDCDNISENTFNYGIIGKMKYMAPEIITGKHLPDVHSDRYSLAIILFQLFTLSHPMVGEHLKKYLYINEQAEFELYGKNPVYVFDQKTVTNRPIRGYHYVLLKRWGYIPNFMKEAFNEIFTKGIEDREYFRLTELNWMKILMKYRNELVTCPICQFQYAGLNENHEHLDTCIHCQAKAPERSILKVDEQYFVIEKGKFIYESFIDKYSVAHQKKHGVVIQNNLNKHVLGIKNVSSSEWEIEDQEGTMKKIGFNKTAPLVRGLSITFFDRNKGQIR